jgi:hypothetical protein
MKTYSVMRNPTNRHTKAIRNGFSWAAFALNLFGFGWIWAFVNSATHFGWRLLVLTLLLIGSTLLENPLLSAVASFMWIVFSISVGMMATDRVRSEVKRLGFLTIAENVEANNDEEAIDLAEKKT